MRVLVVDEDALRSLVPRNIRIYLRSHGWRRNEDLGSPDVWSLSDREGVYEIIAPSSREKKDYTTRASELLRTLSIAENRSEVEVMRDLEITTFDVQYFHSYNDGPPGTAPLRTAAEAFNAAVGLLSATAESLEEPRLVLSPRRSTTTTNFINRVLAGPTQEGSYVISVWVPVPPRLTPDEDQVLFEDPIDAAEPFERKATRQLNRALAAASAATREIMESDAGVEAFTSRYEDGISANLCESLLSLAGGDEEQAVDVHFAWALDRPVVGLSATVAFPAESFPILKEAARLMREQDPELPATIRGNVVRLHRETQSGSGDVTIAGVVAEDDLEKFRKVSVNLSQDDYQKAIAAHDRGSDVEVWGRLQKRGTRTYLVSHTGLTVLKSYS